jgi:GT2 family glycosyltransferase
MGCVLIKREALQKFSFEGSRYHDTFFWGRLKKAGIPVYILAPMEIEHLKLEKKIFIKWLIKTKIIFKQKFPPLFRFLKFIFRRK